MKTTGVLPDARADGLVRSAGWRQHARIVTALTETSGLAIVAYILLGRPERGTAILVLVAVGCSVTPLLLLVPDHWYASGRGQACVAAWNIGIVVLITIGCGLDSGPDSVLIWFNVLALSLASTALAPRFVGGVAAVTIGGYLVLTAAADAFGIRTLVVAFVLVAVSGTTTWVSHKRYLDLARLRATTEGLALANADRERFVAITSHELRTPVASILGYVELLEDAAEEPGADLSAHLETVRRNAERLLLTTNGLLDLARTDQERRESASVDAQCDVAALVGNVIATMAPLAASQGVGVEAEVPGDEPSTAWRVGGAPEQLERVVLNLVSNAVKYSPDGGQVRCTLQRSGAVVELTVRDSGIGMAPEDVDRLFTRFFRARSAKDRSIAGAGLGLSIVHDVVTDLGGDVRVTSTAGSGSCFTVRLPAAVAEPGLGSGPTQSRSASPVG